MTGSNDEDPLERLRAADPAAGGSTPDHRSIRAAVDRRLAADGESADEGTAATDSAALTADVGSAAAPGPAGRGPDELSTRRRRRKPMQYAAAAVGAVLFLGGGYALGSGPGSGAGSADSAAVSDPQAESAGSDHAATEAAPESGTAPQTEPADPDDASSSDRPSPGPQRTVFIADGLPEGPGQAHAYALDGVASSTADHAAALAAALDLAGDPHEESRGTWVVGSDDGSSPVLRLHPDGTLEYADPELQPWHCLPVEPPTEPDSSAGSTAGEGQSGSAECTAPDVPAPPDAAETVAALLTDAGLDADRYQIRTDASTTGATVTATLLLGGQESDVRLVAVVVPEGIAAVRGSIATPTDLGEYPLISPAAAVERLMDPRFSGGADEIVAVPDPRFTDRADDSSAVATVPDPRFSGPAPAPGAPIPWPVRQVQITTAELTLVSVATSAGVLVLPGYDLSGSDTAGNDGTWTVPALTEDAFDFDG